MINAHKQDFTFQKKPCKSFKVLLRDQYECQSGAFPHKSRHTCAHFSWINKDFDEYNTACSWHYACLDLD